MDTPAMPPQTPGTPEQPRPAAAPDQLGPSGLESPAAPEAAPQPGATPPPPPTPVAPSAATPPPVLPADDVATVAQPASGLQASGALPAPAQAGDVDVIEPEWVDKAEEVVRLHRDDPYQEEEAAQDLQKDYLQKRYGLNVAGPDSTGSKPERK